eukprot:m51a1_g14122 putative legumain-like protein (263) ;mRNA; r:185132-186658
MFGNGLGLSTTILRSCTSTIFLAILRGEKPAVGSRKHLKSTTEDHVFIYISDHGGSGVLCFQNEDLEWTALQDALQAMHTNKLYSEEYHAYLTDTWSYASMHYIENAAHNAQTLQDEFDASYVFMQNGTGHYNEPCQYGDAEIPHDFTLASFFGAANAARSAPTATTAEALRRELAAHAAVDRIAERLVQSVNGAVLAAPLLQRDQCVFELGRVLRNTCGRKHEYTASLATTFHRICRQANGRQSFDAVAATLSSECTALVA